MDNFTTVLTSSVIAAGLTSTINWLLQRNNFRDDYYKKIIEHRMERYSRVYRVLSRLQSTEMDGNGMKMHGTLTEFDFYQSFIVDLTQESLEHLWFSRELADGLSQFSYFFHERFGLAATDNFLTADEIQKLARDNYSEITKMKIKLFNRIATDLKTLHNVSDFLKQRG